MALREVIFSLSQYYRTHIRAAVNATDLGLNGMHVRCLHVIAGNSECTANTIVQKIDKDKAQIARLMKEMLDKGWILKQPSIYDKRSQLLSLSESGKQLLKDISTIEEQIEKTILADLSQQDIADFQRIASKMLSNLSDCCSAQHNTRIAGK